MFKKFVITFILLIIGGFVLYHIMGMICAGVISLLVLVSMIPMWFSVLLKYVFYVIGAIILFYILKYTFKNCK